MGTGVWYGSRVPGMPYEITPFATKGVYRAPLLMVPPPPLGSCLGSRSTSARTGRQSHAWVRAVRARGRDDSPPRSHGMRMHIGCASIPPWAPPLLSVPPLGVMLGLIVVAYRSKHADGGTSEVSSVMNLTNSLRSVPVWVLEFDQSHTALAWGATMKS